MMSLASLNNPPAPLIDQIEHPGNPLTTARQALTRPPDLQGMHGVSEELLPSRSFLVSYNGSTATFNSYRREVERLLQWCWLVRGCSLEQLRRQDLESYVQFCQSPPAAWIGKKQVARFRNHQGERV